MPHKDELIVSISFDIEFHSFEEFCIVRDDTLIKGKYVLCIKLVWQINVCSENHILSPSICFLIFNSRIKKINWKSCTWMTNCHLNISMLLS